MSEEVDTLSFLKAVCKIAEEHGLSVVVAAGYSGNGQSAVHGNVYQIWELANGLWTDISRDPDLFEQP